MKIEEESILKDDDTAYARRYAKPSSQ